MPTITVDGGQSSAAVAGKTIQYITAIAQQQLPGCPDTLITSQLTLVLRHFYTESSGWRAPLGPFFIGAGKPDIYLNPVDQDTVVSFVTQAYLYPFPTTASNTRQALKPSTQQVLTNVPGPPVSYFMYASDQLQLQPVPDQTYGAILYVIGALVPSTGAVNLPDITFTHHLDGILAGLYERLYRMPKKPWTDLEGAKMYGRMYREEVLKARDFATRGQGPADVPFVFPSFATSRMQGSQNQFGSSG
jgi:hypothetical protein